MEYTIYKGEDELIHWGIRGMRWGVRRYQNKDGSLTAAGKKKLQAESAKVREQERINKKRKTTQEKFDTLAARKKAAAEEKKALDKGIAVKNSKNKKTANADDLPSGKSIKDMTDDELRTKVARLQNEKMYYDLQKQLAAANPKPVSKGKAFVDSLMNDVVVPAAKNAGKAWAEKFMKDKLGLNQEDSLTRLEKQVKKLELHKKIAELSKKPSGNDNNNDYDLDALLDEYRNTSEDTRKEVSAAAKHRENINKLLKKRGSND